MKQANKQCGRKGRYDSEIDAKLAIKENCGGHPAFNAYLCPHCEYWHYGHRDRMVDDESFRATG